jgi:hypothetical protein
VFSQKLAKRFPDLAHLRDAPTPLGEHDISVAWGDGTHV